MVYFISVTIKICYILMLVKQWYLSSLHISSSRTQSFKGQKFISFQHDFASFKLIMILCTLHSAAATAEFWFFEKAFPEVLKRSNYIGMLQNLDPENISQGKRKPRNIGWVFVCFCGCPLLKDSGYPLTLFEARVGQFVPHHHTLVCSFHRSRARLIKIGDFVSLTILLVQEKPF